MSTTLFRLLLVSAALLTSPSLALASKIIGNG
jgi:hypothetical protein